MIKSRDAKSVAFQVKHLEEEYTRETVLQAFGCDSTCRGSGQYSATVFFVKKTDSTLVFIKEWARLLLQNESFLVKDQEPPSGKFKDHGHDQSISSLLLKQESGIITLTDETGEAFPGKFFSQDALKYPIWAQRKKENAWIKARYSPDCPSLS